MEYETNRRLLELRHALCLTQKEFGEKIHISKGYVSALEKNRQPVNERIIKLISDTYGVNTEWLKSGKKPMLIDPKSSRIAEIAHIFNQLNPDFQNFVIHQLKKLLEMNANYNPETAESGKKPIKGKSGQKQGKKEPLKTCAKNLCKLEPKNFP